MSAECPNRPEWAMPGVPAIVGDGYCSHCSKVAGEWVACEADRNARETVDTGWEDMPARGRTWKSRAEVAEAALAVAEAANERYREALREIVRREGFSFTSMHYATLARAALAAGGAATETTR